MVKGKVPQFVNSELTEKVQILLGIISKLQDEIAVLKKEIASLKGLPSKPNLEPNLKPKTPTEILKGTGEKRTPGGSKPGERTKKTETLKIDKEHRIPPEGEIPKGSQFKGFETYIVQDIALSTFNTCYQLERWMTPDGQTLMGKLPEALRGHFGFNLRTLALVLHTDGRVTEPVLLKILHSFGIQISSGHLHSILTEGHDLFHEEKLSLIDVAKEVCPYLQVDDTGYRHKGINGYTTVVCNPWFTFFSTTSSKSRINFLEILRGQETDYYWNETAHDYAEAGGLNKTALKSIPLGSHFSSKELWNSFLREKDILTDKGIRVATEAALLGSLLLHGLRKDMVLVSDDAGQFNLLRHALCWYHAYRPLAKSLAYTEAQRKMLEKLRDQYWNFYRDLEIYKISPSSDKREKLSETFDQIFSQKTGFLALDEILERLIGNKKELLLVLDCPEIPLHNNQSESDAREKVRRRDISLTFNDLSLKCRDTFSSLSKTCRKLGVSFWTYVLDRLSGQNKILRLSEMIRSRASPCPA